MNPPEMIVDENTKFVPILEHRTEIYYEPPIPIGYAYLMLMNIRPSKPLDTRRRAQFWTYGIGKEIIYRVALAPEINTVFFQLLSAA